MFTDITGSSSAKQMECSTVQYCDPSDLPLRVAVREVRSDARRVHDVVQRKVFDLPREFQQEGHGLTNTSRGSNHRNLDRVEGIRDRSSEEERGLLRWLHD